MQRASAPGYDRFKSIVAFILVVILILMLLRGCAINVASPAPTATIVAPDVTGTISASPIPSTAEPSPAPTPTSAPTQTLTALPPSPTPTSPVVETPTPTPGGFVTPGPAEIDSCNTNMPSRLSVGQRARVLSRLNMRNDPSIDATLIQTNRTNTQVEIIGGPVCTPVGDAAYQWWQIRLADGTEGWSAESPLNNSFYFLEPIP